MQGKEPRVANERLYSLDTYRGLTMLLLAFTVPNYDWAANIAAENSGSWFVESLMWHFEHVAWQGLALWDMIQPSFMFMVGVSLVYSCHARQRRGHSFAQMLAHAIFRSLFLILLGVFLRSLGRESTNWTFEDVVTQIGLGYVPLFLLWHARRRIQIAVFAAILIGTWALFVLWPVGNADAELSGFYAHWNKTGHPAQAADQWFLNLFPRDTPFLANEGGYYTLNFVPALATMILGLLAGNVLYQQSSSEFKLRRLILGGLVLFIGGIALHVGGICPIVKKIWTPSFVLVSGGLCLWTLALLYYFVDLRKWHKISFPARVVGMNSMAMYCMTYLISSWLARNLLTHFGAGVFATWGAAYRALLLNLAVGLCLWLICYWMYRRQLFLRI